MIWKLVDFGPASVFPEQHGANRLCNWPSDLVLLVHVSTKLFLRESFVKFLRLLVLT